MAATVRAARAARLIALGARAGPIGAAVAASVVGALALKKALSHETIPSRYLKPPVPTTPMAGNGKRKAPAQIGGPPKRQRRVSRGSPSMVGYEITAPIAGSVVTSRPRVPRLISTANSAIVSNTEVIVNMTLPALGAFSTFNLALIPGVPNWLAGVGDLYSKFRWRSIEVIYIPTCPTTVQGKICLALGYDRLDAAPTSAANLSQNYKAITFPPYAGYGGAGALAGLSSPEAIIVKADPSRFDKPWYPTIANATFGPLAGNLQNQYCPATIFAAVEGGPAAATVVGDLYYRYVCEFIEPVNPQMNV